MKGTLNLWLLVIAVACGLSLWFGRGLVDGAASETAASPSAGNGSTPVRPRLELAPAEEPVHLEVLNGTPEAGLAREFGLLLGRAGCVAEQLGNAPHADYSRSFLVNRRLPDDRAAILADRLGDLPVLREFDGRSTADAVLVLGRDADRVRAKLLAGGGS